MVTSILLALTTTQVWGGSLPALAALCGVLFIEECGLPLPFLPGDILLVGGGILVATGRASLWLLVLSTTVAMCAGALVGHGWTRALGRPLVMRAARRLGAGDRFEAVMERLRAGGWPAVTLCRLVPGLRVYTNMAAGVAGVRRSTFVAGLVPSVLAWTVGFGVLGMLVGKPVEHAMSTARRDVPVALFVALLAGAVLATIRYLPARSQVAVGVMRPHPMRMAGAGIVDVLAGGLLVAGALEGFEALVRVGERAGTGIECAVAAATLIVYIAISRTTLGATAGERILRVTYLRRRVATGSGA